MGMDSCGVEESQISGPILDINVAQRRLAGSFFPDLGPDDSGGEFVAQAH